ncbi:OmpA family protein [Pseudothauera nasutitermitis]
MKTKGGAMRRILPLALALLSAGCASLPDQETALRWGTEQGANAAGVLGGYKLSTAAASELGISTTNLFSGALIAYAIHDPLTPNWQISASRSEEEVWQLDLRMKRMVTGGEGEARQVFQRAARQLVAEGGYAGFDVLRYEEGVDSQRPLARRIAQGEIRLVGSRQFPGGLQGGGLPPQAGIAGAQAFAVASAADSVSAASAQSLAGTGSPSLSADALFDFDKAELRPMGRIQLDQLANRIRELNLNVVLAVGHTDRLGSNAYNQRLSERRVAAVKSYLVSQGVEAGRIYTEGRGESQPLTGTACDAIVNRAELIACLQPDRRVEVIALR